jgi:hypothetical protein
MGKRFYTGFVEYGTVFQRAQPFVTPAAERHRDTFINKAKRLESKL